MSSNPPADAALADLLSRCAHDMRAALAAIQGYTGLLASGQPGALTQRQGTFLGHILVQQEELGKRLEAFTTLARYLAGARSVASIELDLGAELDRYASARRNSESDPLLAMSVRAPVMAVADADLLADVLDLVLPVFVVSGSAWHACVTLSCATSEERAWITIKDAGQAVRPDREDMILLVANRLLEMQAGSVEWTGGPHSSEEFDADLVCRIGFPLPAD